ncbi:MAG: hypothetical protein HY482_01540 [Candidatus Wildermuthbacteria bacterium]|nr:hypothetical protein [Candidatus Wildermuthbacteria bacterium]
MYPEVSGDSAPLRPAHFVEIFRAAFLRVLNSQDGAALELGRFFKRGYYPPFGFLQRIEDAMRSYAYVVTGHMRKKDKESVFLLQ